MVDDIDGSQDDVKTVRIALDSLSHEIDLSADNAARLGDYPVSERGCITKKI